MAAMKSKLRRSNVTDISAFFDPLELLCIVERWRRTGMVAVRIFTTTPVGVNADDRATR